MKAKLLIIFRIPETVVAFFFFFLISAAINIFTSKDLFQNICVAISAALMVIASAVLVVWSIIVKPIEEEFQKERYENNDLLVLWKDIFELHNGALVKLCICLAVFLSCFVSSIILLLV